MKLNKTGRDSKDIEIFDFYYFYLKIDTSNFKLSQFLDYL